MSRGGGKGTGEKSESNQGWHRVMLNFLLLLSGTASCFCVRVRHGVTWYTEYSRGRIRSNGAWFLSHSYQTRSVQHHILTKPTPDIWLPATWPGRHHPRSALVPQDSFSPFSIGWPGLLNVLLSIRLQFEAMCMQKKWHSVPESLPPSEQQQ